MKEGSLKTDSLCLVSQSNAPRGHSSPKWKKEGWGRGGMKGHQWCHLRQWKLPP